MLAAKHPEDAPTVVKALSALSGARYLRHELAEVEAKPALLDAVGPVDCLVSNAGVPARKRADMPDLEPSNFDWPLSINLRGTFFGSAGRAADAGADERELSKHDLRHFVQRRKGVGGKLVQDIMSQDALSPFLKREVIPGPDVCSDQDYLEHACANAKSDHHLAGTCHMGSASAAVVDTRLRMNGIDGLSVVDASITPRLVLSNTNAPTIMISEMAPDVIREHNGAGVMILPLPDGTSQDFTPTRDQLLPRARDRRAIGMQR